MSFDLVKNRIALRLSGLGYQESSVIEFTQMPSAEYGNTFIIKALSGAMDDVESETLIDRFYDVQLWQVQIAFDKNAQNEVINKDDLHRKKDLILKDLDNPANWSDVVRILKYKTWDVTEYPNYFVLTISLKIVDTYTY